MPHKTWFLQAIRPQAKPAPGGRFSCPFCPRTAEYPAVVAHLQCHQRSMVEYEGYNIFKCHLTCLKEGHYHCDACQRVIVRKELFEKHLRKCSSSSRKHQAVTPDVAVVSDPPSADTARTETGISPDACSKRKSASTACGWSSGETTYLISIWAEGPVQKMLEDSYRNRAVYESIAQKMNDLGYKRTWQQCQRKIKQLKRLYRKVKNSSSKSDRADRTSFPFYDKLDQVLRDRLPFCPGEEVVLDSAESELSFCTETAEASESPITENTDGESDDSGGHGDGARTEAEISSGASRKRKSTSATRGTTRRKKSKFDTALGLIAKALADGRDDEVLLKMQQAQHAHEEKLFGMMMQSIAMLVSAQHSPGNSASL